MTSAVTVRPFDRPIQNQTIQVRDEADWTWEDLRDLVVSKIQEIHGDFPRKPPYIEKAIFKSFLERWGAQAPAIAKYAYDIMGGYWHSAPIRVERFCLNSDPYFAAVIAERLNALT